MFNKITAIEPVSLTEWAEKKLYSYAKEVVMYPDIPADDDEIIKRIGDSDAVLLSYTSKINSYVLENVKNVKYIGMCCSLYSKESANVDIAYAEEHGITVKGIRDYGDRGVVEFAVYELVKILHEYDGFTFHGTAEEIYKKKVGIIGLGVSGSMIAEAMNFFGAEVSYYSRTRKPEQENKGIEYKELKVLLSESDIVFACLNKNVILLHEEEFKALGNGKILFNTSIGPAHDEEALKNWLADKSNYFVADTFGAIGTMAEELTKLPNVVCVNKSAGRTVQAFELLSQKVLDNIESVCK